MLDLPSSLPSPEKMQPEDRMYVHKTRPQWGVGLWVREEQTRRRMRFEDGEMRAFKKGFYHLLEPVDPDRDDLDELFEVLASDHEQALAERQAEKAKKEQPPVMSFAQQVRVFQHLYPDGFRGPDYIDAARGDGEGAWCKRHVGEDIAKAQAAFAKRTMQEQMKDEDHDAIVGAMIDVLSRTTLVKPTAGLKPMQKLEDDQTKQELALALYQLLHGKKAFRKRFRLWIRTLEGALGDAPTWPLATVFPALVFPEEHVCVKRSVFDLQAREVKPGTRVPDRVSRRGYRRARRITRAVRSELEDAGLEPRDMLDVRRFIWDTLRPKGREILDSLTA